MIMLWGVMALITASLAFFLCHALLGRHAGMMIPDQSARRAALMIIILLPLCGIAGYLVLGHPDLTDMPLSSRDDLPVKQAFDQAYNKMLTMGETLRTKGGPPEQWEKLAKVAMVFRNDALVEMAARHLVTEQPQNPDYLVLMIQVLMVQSNGQVTREAQKFLDELTKIAPNHPVLVTLMAHKKPVGP